MKIFFYIHSLTGGGAERVTANLTRHLADQGHEVGVITMTSKERDFYPIDSRVHRITLNQSSVNRGFGKLVANYRRWLALRRILKVERPDVVVAMMTTSIVLGILAAIALPVRIYGSERNYPGRKVAPWPWAMLRRLVYRFASGHIAQTRETAAWLEHHADARNVHVIPNAVVWPIPSFEPEIIPESVVPSDRKVILAVGSKPHQKGFDLLVRAFARMAEDRPNWDLVILGVDPESKAASGGGASVRQLAKEVGVVQRLHLPGRVGNVADWYRRADIFVLSSRYEGFPNVLLEAMASGCPSIAFDCDTGPRDIIQNGVNGLLVTAQNVDALQDAIVKLVADQGLRTKCGERAVMVREKFAEEKIVALWSEVIAI